MLDNDEAEEEPMASQIKRSDDMLLLKKVKRNIRAAKDHLKLWKQEAQECYDFFAGDQWDPEDAMKLKAENRPVIVFNRIPRVINAVAGIELQNRQEVTYLPRTNDDLQKSDVLTDAAKWVRQKCDAEDEESQAFKDSLMVGLGFTETYLDYESDPDGMIIIERIDPLEMLYDPSSKKRNLDDASWLARTRHYEREDFEQIWPDAIDEIDVTFSDNPSPTEPHDDTLAPWYINDQSDKEENRNINTVEVVQYQWWEREPYYRVEYHDGQVDSFSPQDFRKNRDKINILARKWIRQYRRSYKQMFYVGDYILEKGDSPVDGFTFRAMTGLINQKKRTWFGLIKIILDCQRWSNKWLSQILHILNSNAKGGYLAEEDAFADPRQAENSLATTSITYVNEDMLDKIKEKIPPGFPAGLDKLLQYAMSGVSDLVGVNLEMLGMANREQSGVVEYQRKKAGITVVADFFDSLRRYRKEQGRILSKFITEYISDGRLIRVVGQPLAAAVPLIKDKMAEQYDIIVDESPTSPNQREVIFDRLVTLFPTLIQANIPIPTEILDYAPLPSQLIAAWKKEIEQQSQPNPNAQKVEELRLRLAEAETALKEKEVVDKDASTTEKQTKSALNIAKASHEEALADMESKNSAINRIEKVMNVFTPNQ